MKRLTDAQVATGYERQPGAPSAKSLRKDHDQARKDVALLAAMLRVAVAQLDGKEAPMIKPVDRSAGREIKSAVTQMRIVLSEVGR